MRTIAILFSVFALFAVAQNLQASTTTDVNADWRQAFNAALARVISSGEFLELRSKWEISEIIACFTCAPSPSVMPYPPASSATGKLKKILANKEIVITGYYYNDLPSGNYMVDPPVGFWPEYFSLIVSKLSEEYGQLNIKRLYFKSSLDALDAVATGKADISELYYVIGGFYNGRPRIEAFDIPCTAGAYESSAWTASTSSITSMDSLRNAITRGDNKKVGFMSTGDFNAVEAVLPSSVQPVYIFDDEELHQAVVNGTLLAVVTSSRPPETPDIQIFGSGVISPRTGFIGRDGILSSTITMSLLLLVSFVGIVFFQMM
ncbi:hypothetical protein WA158_006271 [Blastocystis sp. Blastoise]